MKISKVKRSNQKRTKLKAQGKSKTRRHRPKKKIPQKVPMKPSEFEEEYDEKEYTQDLKNMIEDDDMIFLNNAVQKKSYEFLKKACTRNKEKEGNLKKRKFEESEENHDNIENRYERNVFKPSRNEKAKEMKLMLPVKTKEGIVKKMLIEKEEEEELINNKDIENNNLKQDKDSEDEMILPEALKLETNEPLTTAKLLAIREETLRTYKFKIGVLSSEVLENPEVKVKNLQQLVRFMDERSPGISITVQKWSICSLCQIFVDLLPSYNIVQINQEGVKLKKETLQLKNYETALLAYYKQYLKRLEKISGILRQKHNGGKINQEEFGVGKVALESMCEILTTHQYFNFSSNIANFLVPFLNTKHTDVRTVVANCIRNIFKEDKRGELSLTIVRRLNQFVKLHGHSVHTEVILVLLDLRIKDVNLDKEKEEETKQKKLMSHKQRIIALSKKERKRSKKLQEVEKELLETKAVESKQAKQKVYTEITSLVFTIYFRILKHAPNSKILTACLEGLSKFAHCINIDFYQDLVNVLNKLLDEGEIGTKEQLYCIQTVFVMLSGQASTLNIDPIRFYSHLYKNLFKTNVGRFDVEAEILIKTLLQALIYRYKNVTQNRLLAFIKRIFIVSLQSNNNVTLGMLGIVKKLMQTGKGTGILLDTDCGVGDGLYLPELEDPEYCNARSAAVWEVVGLQRHYHTVVRSMAKNIAMELPTTGEGSLPVELSKLSPEELYNQYNTDHDIFQGVSNAKRNNKLNSKNFPRKSNSHNFINSNLEALANKIYNRVLTGNLDLHNELLIKNNANKN